ARHGTPNSSRWKFARPLFSIKARLTTPARSLQMLLLLAAFPTAGNVACANRCQSSQNERHHSSTKTARKIPGRWRSLPLQLAPVFGGCRGRRWIFDCAANSAAARFAPDGVPSRPCDRRLVERRVARRVLLGLRRLVSHALGMD